MSAILFEKRGHVAWVTLNRPEAKNTLNAEAFVQLAEAWDEVSADGDIRVAVLTAAGDQDFCCGGDLSGLIPLWTGQKQPENDIEKKLQADPTIPDKVLLKQAPVYKPIIAAINGRALGGGCELLQATDLRIAARHATFGLPEPRVGIIPGGGSMVRLARQIPWAHAMKLLLSAQPVDAEEALKMGLISDIAPAGELLTRAERDAARIASLAPLALQAIKRTALETHTTAWPEAFQFEMQQAADVMMSSDAREGNRAFREKREPEFKGQ